MLGLYNNPYSQPTAFELVYGEVNTLTFEFTPISSEKYLNSQHLSFVILGYMALNTIDNLSTFVVGDGFSGADLATFRITSGDVVAVGGTNPSQPQGMLWINP